MIVKDNVPIEDLVKNIFRDTYFYYEYEDDELYHDAILRERLRNAVKILRSSYKPTDRNSNCDSFYSDKDICDAYMLAYYPYYIEPARYVVENFVAPNFDYAFYELELNFFACGPCPELYGTLLALRDKNFHGKVCVNTYDAEWLWIAYQDYITYFLCKEILPIEHWTFYPNFFVGDSLSFPKYIVDFNGHYTQRRIFFLQNYLSHMPDTPKAVEKFLSWFQKLLHYGDRRDCFVFIDLNYNSTATVFRRLVDEEFLAKNDLYKVAAHIPDDGEPLTIRHGDTIKALRDNIFTDTFESGSGLIQKKRTNFYFVVLKKFSGVI